MRFGDRIGLRLDLGNAYFLRPVDAEAISAATPVASPNAEPIPLPG